MHKRDIETIERVVGIAIIAGGVGAAALVVLVALALLAIR